VSVVSVVCRREAPLPVMLLRCPSFGGIVVMCYVSCNHHLVSSITYVCSSVRSVLCVCVAPEANVKLKVSGVCVCVGA
jgi:hypothetical protein